jgi:hypothetical protein
MTYNPKIVIAFFKSEGIPEPKVEYKFHAERKWRFDFAWEESCEPDPFTLSLPLALEVQGGLFVHGGHNRGAQMLKEYEKTNEAAALGWRILHVQPKDLCLVSTANLIKQCLGI